MEYWIRPNIKFTSYNRHGDDIIVLKNSCNHPEDFLSYAENYFKAGYLLTEHLVTDVCDKGDIAKLDCWFFAVAYLYRQSLELILKAAMFKSGIAPEKVISEVRHNLSIGIELFSMSLPESTLSNENFQWLTSYFNDISDIDSESDMFRYPFSFKMKAFVTKQIHLDYISITENVERAFFTLKSIINNSIATYNADSANPPVFLVEGGHYYQQAVIGYKFSQNDFYPYIKSYSECANFLYDKIIDDSNNKALFLPMCYLFRNAIELELKKIYLTHCSLESVRHQVLSYKHKLQKLWKEAKYTVAEYSNAPAEDTTLQDFENYISQLNDWDGCSSTFRYPLDKSQQFFFRRDTRYNLKNIAECFNDMCYFLDCVEAQLDSVLEFKNEMEAEMRQYYDPY